MNQLPSFRRGQFRLAPDWLDGRRSFTRSKYRCQSAIRASSQNSIFAAAGERKGLGTLFDKRYWPGESFADHLTFALRHEEIDLLILKRVFEAVPPAEVEAFVRAAPTGAVARRAWYLYEILTGRTLDIEDAPIAAAVDLLDPEAYFTGKPKLSTRHRVRDNLLGTGQFCPMIRRTPALTEFVRLDLAAEARKIVGHTGAHVVARAASFLLLADSRASFEIEGERPPRNRLERWGRAVMQAGKNPLTLDEILRLQRVLIEDARFVRPGLRPDGVFLGERDHFGDPLPEFIGARPDNLAGLMAGLIEANDRMRTDGIDPVLKAAASAFGFVYIHPFQDGNGRMHRCLIHHVLAERKFTPPGMVFPVSSVMLDRIDEYRAALQAHSGPLMSVHSFGPVIPMADRERIFDRYYRSSTYSNRAPGTGIGLSVAKRVALMHGGYVWVTSDEVEGTTFFAAIPDLSAEGVYLMSQPAIRILVVDDESAIRRALRPPLVELGFQVADCLARRRGAADAARRGLRCGSARHQYARHRRH